MIVSVRLEAEGYDLDTVVKDLDAIEAAVMALSDIHAPQVGGPDTPEQRYPIPLNTGVTDEHYERARKKGETFFKGRRVIKFLGIAAWDAYEPETQPRMVAAFSNGGISSTIPLTTVTTSAA